MVKKKRAEPRRISITQVRSRIGRPEKHRKILDALGLKRHQKTVVHEDTPAIRGMIDQIPHLVRVEEVGE